MPKVPYPKQIQTFANQIGILKQRGMTFADEAAAEAWLHRVSYYRMSGYWYPLLADRVNHTFKPGATFEQAVSLYEFDSRLRELVFRNIGRIEVAVRTQMTYVMSMAKGGTWFADASLFNNTAQHAKTLQSIAEEYHRSDEQFVRAFKRKYSDPLPPSWMTLEVTSFGTMSILYQYLKPGISKREVAAVFGVSDTVFASWLHTLVYVRNICAHHARLWNRTLGVRPLMPRHRAACNRYTACLFRTCHHSLLAERHRFSEYANAGHAATLLQIPECSCGRPWFPAELGAGTIVAIITI